MSHLRRCIKCEKSKPLEENFKKQGRGHLHICHDCRVPMMQKAREKRPLPDTPDDTNALLSEIIHLLRSPVCARCGARGADLGNPSLCRRCK